MIRLVTWIDCLLLVPKLTKTMTHGTHVIPDVRFGPTTTGKTAVVDMMDPVERSPLATTLDQRRPQARRVWMVLYGVHAQSVNLVRPTKRPDGDRDVVRPERLALCLG